jgi:hypothetical protein
VRPAGRVVAYLEVGGCEVCDFGGGGGHCCLLLLLLESYFHGGWSAGLNSALPGDGACALDDPRLGDPLTPFGLDDLTFCDG